MRALILTTQVPFVSGGAEILVEDLRKALIDRGVRAESVAVPFIWYPISAFRKQIKAHRMLDVSSFCDKVDLVIGMKFPAYLIHHPNKVLWIAHQHRSAYDLIGNPHEGLDQIRGGREAVEAVRRADASCFGGCRARFTISRNVSRRLRKFNGFASKALRPPPRNEGEYYSETGGDYFFFPSRMNWIKRQALAVAALSFTRNPVKVVFAGAADHPGHLEALRTMAWTSGVADRAVFLGKVSERRKLKLYAGSLGVVFPPLDEDYGYVTPEAMLARKPVITCSDSGGPLEFVSHRETGLVCPIGGGPAALAEAMDELWEKRRWARELGRNGRARYLGMAHSWDAIVDELLAGSRGTAAG